MAKTATQAVRLLSDYLNNSVLMSEATGPNGRVYKYQRPSGSKTEDVVVNSLVVDRAQLQRGILNVNIYVPNLKSDTSLPNMNRLEELELLMESVFDGNSEIISEDGTHNFKIDRQYLLPDQNNQHYLNFRIEFRNVNLN